jgi:MocE subfamily Rieske [2Fe-2S] domain protein
VSSKPTKSEATEKVTFPDPSLYSLNRDNSRRALEAGLAEADWYQCPVPRSKMRELLVRRDGPAIRDTLLWLGVIATAAAATTVLWGSWWAIFPYLIYAALYGGSADSRWHESLHGTAFKTDWMNRALYELASFMVLRESAIWRWSHTRHHSDTIIVGRDPEIAAPRPPDLVGMFLGVFAIRSYPQYFQSLFRHAFGKMSEAEREFVPEDEFPGVFRTARIHLAIYLGVIILAFALQSWLPLFLVGFPNFFGRWMMILFGLTQHTGLAEDVLDHRLNSRTFLTNRLNRFLYWNMNYHIEHHIFPLVPYHALPELHELVKADCPPPYPSLWSCWREIIPTLIRQTRDPSYHIRRVLPESAGRMTEKNITEAVPDDEGWLRVCAASDLQAAEARRFDHREQTYAIYRDGEGTLFATDGICTHGRTHLSEGLVIEKMIECPKHNGRFNLEDGSPARKPVCRALQTYEIIEKEGGIFLRLPVPD